jgi:hypothetical protein
MGVECCELEGGSGIEQISSGCLETWARVHGVVQAGEWPKPSGGVKKASSAGLSQWQDRAMACAP